MKLLEDKTVLVTASSSEIGSAMVRALVRHGAKVGLHYRTHRDTAENLAREMTELGGRVSTAHAELTDADSVQGMIAGITAELGPMDALVNNASVYRNPAPAALVPWEDFQAEFEGSLKTSVACAQAVLPGMMERRSGIILNIVGTMVQRPASGHSAHIAGKGALLAWSRALAKELGPQGIRVHCISPGMTLTDNTLRTTTQDQRTTVNDKTPMRKLPLPAHIANLTVFLLSDLASAETGYHLNADGGLAELGG